MPHPASLATCMVLATLVGLAWPCPTITLFLCLPMLIVIGYVCASGKVVVDDEGTVGGT